MLRILDSINNDSVNIGSVFFLIKVTNNMIKILLVTFIILIKFSLIDRKLFLYNYF